MPDSSIHYIYVLTPEAKELWPVEKIAVMIGDRSMIASPKSIGYRTLTRYG
jgi:hypothetical protein